MQHDLHSGSCRKARLQPPPAAHVPFGGGAFASFVGPTPAPLTAHFTTAGEEAVVDAGDGGEAVVDVGGGGEAVGGTEGGVPAVAPTLGVGTTGELGFPGPPIVYCLAGPPTAVCFLGPPRGGCAEATL